MSEPHMNSDLPNVMDNGNNSPWPGGWFVFEDGRVQGPFSADAAFAMPEKSLAGTPKLVSRKGFSQWYPLKDLSELYRIADKLGHRTSNEVEKLEAEVTENLANLEVLRALAQTGADPSVIARTPRVVGKSIDAQHTSSVRPVINKFSNEALNDDLSKEPFREPIEESPRDFAAEAKAEPILSFAGEPKQEAPASPGPVRRTMGRKERKAMTRRAAGKKTLETERLRPKQTEVSGSAKAQPISMPNAEPQVSAPQMNLSGGTRKLTAKQALLQEYLMLRGRLRLGEMRSPFLTAFLLAPLTLLIYWGIWYRDLTRELIWHTRNNGDVNNSNKDSSNTWLAWIPLVHIYMAYRLAALVREAEVQNGYKAISPVIAGLFAVIPPLAMAYIQDSANQHWRLHVKHSILDRMRQ